MCWIQGKRFLRHPFGFEGRPRGILAEVTAVLECGPGENPPSDDKVRIKRNRLPCQLLSSLQVGFCETS